VVGPAGLEPATY